MKNTLSYLTTIPSKKSLLFSLILGLIVCSMFSSCSNREKLYDNKFNTHSFVKHQVIYGSGEYDKFTVREVIIDSCQYFAGFGDGGNSGPILCHKGNCNNPIHKTK